MKPWETLAKSITPDGGELVLQRRDREWVIRTGGQVLMSSRMHESERALAEAAIEHLRGHPAPRVLVGGLGLACTLRALLDGFPPSARITVAELSPAIVEWNRTLLTELSGDALSDARVELQVGDVAKVIRRGKQAFDAILLDVDNGPSALSQSDNRALYSQSALEAARAALAEGGLYVVWSAGADDAFLSRMRKAGFDARTRTVRSGGSRHVLFVGVVPKGR